MWGIATVFYHHDCIASYKSGVGKVQCFCFHCTCSCSSDDIVTFFYICNATITYVTQICIPCDNVTFIRGPNCMIPPLLITHSKCMIYVSLTLPLMEIWKKDMPRQSSLMSKRGKKRTRHARKSRRYAHITDVAMKASARHKENGATSHLCHFLMLQYQDEYKTVEHLRHEDINQELFGSFATYLGTDATKYLKKDGVKISLNTALGYMSSVKSLFMHKFNDKAVPPVFTKQHWGKLLAGITAKKAEYARAHGLKLVDPHAKADDADRLALLATCIWKGDNSSAQFAHLFNAMVHCVGRASEVSVSKKSGLGVRAVKEAFKNYHVIETDMDRMKTTSSQSLSIYPDHTEGLFDFYWTCGYNLVTDQNGGSDEIFPEFADMVLGRGDGAVDLRVSNLFTSCYSALLKVVDEYIEGELDIDLCIMQHFKV